MKRALSILLKSLGYLILVAVCLLFLAFYALQLPEVQTQISNRATEWLGQRLGGNITMSKVRVSWFDEVVFEDLNIKDNKDRNMIYVREVYVNVKTNFNFQLDDVIQIDSTQKGLSSIKFQPGKIVKFDNNLDFVTLNNPEVNFIRDSTNMLNFDYWLLEIDKLTKKDPKKNKPVVPFTLDNANIKNGRLRIISEKYPRKTDGTFDFSNFEFEDLNARLEKLSFKRDTIVFVSKHLNAKDAYSGLNLKEATGDFFHCKKGIRLDNFFMHLNDSYLQDRLHMSYSRPRDFGDFFHKINLDADLKKTSLQAKDIALFIPTMKQYTEVYKMEGKLKGTVADLHLENFTVSFGKGSHIGGKAHLVGLPNLAQVHSTLDIQPSLFLAEDVKQYSANEKFQKYIQKLERLEFSGQFAGLYNAFRSKPKLYSPRIGSIDGDVNVVAQEKLDYSGELAINNLNIGDLLDNKQLDKFTFKGKIKGHGRKLAEANIHLDGHVQEIDFRNYRYRNIEVNGNLGQSLFEGNLMIDDPNVVADLTGRVDFNQAVNAFNFDGKVTHANLKVLGFTNKEFKLKTNLDFDFKGNKLDEWQGQASFSNLEMTEGDSTLKANSVAFHSQISGKQRNIKVLSEFFDLNINGNYVPSVLITDVTTLVKEHLMYFKTTEQERLDYYEDKYRKEEYHSEDYRTQFTLKFKESKPFFDFFAPKAYVAKNTWVTGDYNAGLKNTLHLSGETDTLTLKGNEFYSTIIDFYSEKDILSPQIINKVRIKSDKQKIGKDNHTEELVINGNWEGNNTIDFRTFITQASTASLVDLRGKIDFGTEGFQVQLLPEQSMLKLINLDWQIDPRNRIEVKKKDVLFENFLIAGGDGQRISLNGKVSEDTKEVVTLDVNQFKIENLLPFINVELKGKATGILRVRNFYENPLYFTNLHVEDFYYKKSLIGTVTTSALWDDANERLKIDADVYRFYEEILTLNGYYTPRLKEKGLDLDGKMKNADLSMFLGMTGDVFSKLSGKAEGDFKVSGTPRKPIFNGEIDITNGSLEVAISGTELFFEDKVILTPRGFELPKKGVELRDAPKGNVGLLTGGVYFKMDKPGFDVDLTAVIDPKNSFKVMNIKPFANDYIFGIVYANGDLNLGGDFDDLLITGNLTSREGTHITIPTDGGTKIDTQQEGIQFIKKPVAADANLIPNRKRVPTLKTGGVRVAFNMTLTPEAEGDIVFDRNNNDVLNIFGDGKLSLLYDSRGEFIINGPYNVRGGKYFFSFQNLASLRRFNIADNSRIIFNGDPFEANLDIKATYSTNISINKVSPQLSNSSARFPVFVNVFLKDRLLTPTISYDVEFDLKQVPISGQTDLLAFEQRLRNDEQLMSRNVSSILVLNEVFPDNNIADAINQQFLIDNISSLVSNQIGNLASKLNPNLEFGLRFGDFRENLLNNMQLDFSYKFLNNRVKLSGKGAFINSLENNINMNTTTYGQFSVGGELEYNISDDGAYKFKIYSRSVPTNYYVFYSQGNVVVSGGSFIITRNFNHFFKRNNTIPLGVGVRDSLNTTDL